MQRLEGIPLVLLDKMKIVPSNNNSPVHLSTVASTRKDTTPDRNIASEGTFLINVGSCTKERKQQITSISTIAYSPMAVNKKQTFELNVTLTRMTN